MKFYCQLISSQFAFHVIFATTLFNYIAHKFNIDRNVNNALNNTNCSLLFALNNQTIEKLRMNR